MVKELKSRQKNLRVTPSNFDMAEEIKEELGMSDSDIYEAGLRVSKTIVHTSVLDDSILRNMYKFDKLRTVKCLNCGSSFRTSQTAGGRCTRCNYSNNPNALRAKRKFKQVTCSNCGQGYMTSRVHSYCFKCEQENQLNVKLYDDVETDDLVEEEAQGNAGAETLSMRAKMYFSISDQEWDALSEMEKVDYINRLPGQKTRAGGGEMSNRDALQLEHDAVADDVKKFFAEIYLRKTDRLERKRQKYDSDRER